MRSRVTTIRTTLTGLALTATLTGLLTGCGDDTPGSSGSSGSPTSSSDATSPSDDTATGEASPTVTPATGRLVQIAILDLHLPDDPEWMLDDRDAIKIADLFVDEGVVSILVSSLATVSNDFELIATNRFESEKGQIPSLKRLENRTIDNVEVYAFEGFEDGDINYQVGGLHGGHLWSIAFDIPGAWAQGRQLIEEILASVTFKPPAG